MTPEVQAAIWLSAHKALPALLRGHDPQPVVWGHDGHLLGWDRPPVLAVGPSMDKILETVCEVAKVARREILGERRDRRIVRPRQIACHLIHRRWPQVALFKIGLFMGDRDHTTIRHAIKRIPDLRIEEPFTDRMYREVEQRLAAR